MTSENAPPRIATNAPPTVRIPLVRICGLYWNETLGPAFAFHGLDQVGDQIRAALGLVLHLAPGGLDSLLLGDEGVVARPAAGQRQDEKRGVLAHTHCGSPCGSV